MHLALGEGDELEGLTCVEWDVCTVRETGMQSLQRFQVCGEH